MLKEIKINFKDFFLKEISKGDDLSGEAYKEELPIFQYFDTKLIGLLSDVIMNEDICVGMVQKEFDPQTSFLSGYTFINQISYTPYKRAIDCFLAFLNCENIDMTKEYLLIEKIGAMK